MGSSDSSCCGSHGHAGYVSKETNTTLLKQHRANQLITSGTTQHHYTCNDTDIATESVLETVETPPPPPTLTRMTQSPLTPKANVDQLIRMTKKKKKRKYNKVRTQIEILCSDNARAQSLLLCSKPEKIYRKGKLKEFGFLRYLETTYLRNQSLDYSVNSPHKTMRAATVTGNSVALNLYHY
eukprot:598453_1